MKQRSLEIIVKLFVAEENRSTNVKWLGQDSNTIVVCAMGKNGGHNDVQTYTFSNILDRGSLNNSNV